MNKVVPIDNKAEQGHLHPTSAWTAQCGTVVGNPSSDDGAFNVDRIGASLNRHTAEAFGETSSARASFVQPLPLFQRGMSVLAENENSLDHMIKTARSRKKAEQFRDLSCPRRVLHDGSIVPYSVLHCNDEDFRAWGLGTMLYFQTLRRMAWLFFILFLCCVPLIIINSLGSGSIGSTYPLMSTTLGNLGANSTTSNTTVTIFGLDKKDIGLVYAGTDALCMLIFFLFWILQQAHHAKETRDYYASILTVSRYSVAVTNLPRSVFTRHQLRDHFSQFGRVVDVSILYSNFKLIELYCERGKLRKQLSEAEHDYASEKTRLAIAEKILETEHHIAIEKAYTSNHAVIAYVTFEQQTDSDRCVSSYVDSFWYRCFMPTQLKLKGKRLHVARAPEPSNILYHNLRFNSTSKRCRRALTAVSSIALLAVTTAIVYTAQYVHNNKIPVVASCTSSNMPDKSFDLETAASDGAPQAEIDCACSQLTLSSLLTLHSYCESYIQAWLFTQSLVLLTACSTLIMNKVIQFAVTKISKTEKHTSRSSQQRGMAKKLTVGLVLNTGIIILLVNADLSAFFEALELTFLDNTSGYSDLTPSWFSNVGQSILITMAIGALLPTCAIFFDFFRDWYRRTQADLETYVKSQEELNKIFDGRSFLLDERYATMLVTIFVCFMYSAGMPLLLMIASCTFAATYWSERFAFVHSIRIPPRYDEQLNLLANSYLPFAGCLHSIMTIGFYSSVCLDSYRITSSQSDILAAERELSNAPLNLQDRLVEWNVIPSVIIVGMLILAYLCREIWAVMSFQWLCGRHRVDQMAKILPKYFGHIGERPNYFEASARVRLESYRLEKQQHWRIGYLVTPSKCQLQREAEFSDVTAILGDIKQSRGSVFTQSINYSSMNVRQSRVLLKPCEDNASANTRQHSQNQSLCFQEKGDVSDYDVSSTKVNKCSEYQQNVATNKMHLLPEVQEQSREDSIECVDIEAADLPHRRASSEMLSKDRSHQYSHVQTAGALHNYHHASGNGKDTHFRSLSEAHPMSKNSNQLIVIQRKYAHTPQISHTATVQKPTVSIPHIKESTSKQEETTEKQNLRIALNGIPQIQPAARSLAHFTVDELQKMNYKAVNELWKAYDPNNIGHLSKKNLKKLARDSSDKMLMSISENLRRTNPGLTDAELDRAIAQELAYCLPGGSKVKNRADLYLLLERRLRTCIDINRDGEISKEELHARWNVFSASLFAVQALNGSSLHQPQSLQCVIT